MAVTPEGVRGGDPAVLEALIARRGPAVLAFCEAVCEPSVAARAAAEAFARFRALVVAVPDADGVDPEQFLIGATRHAAAAMARPPSEDRGVLRSIGRATSPETSAAVPTLLAARADSMLGVEDLERLTRLLERSASCREVEGAFRRAEQGYRSPPSRELPPDSVALIVATMQAAAPVDPAFERLEVPAGGGPAAAVTTAEPEPEHAEPGDGNPDAPDAPLVDEAQPAAPEAIPAHAEPEPEPLPVGPGEPGEPAPFVLDDEGDPDDHDEHHADDLPPIPLADQTLITRADAVDPVHAPPPKPPSRLRGALRLPHGGGLHLPRRPGPRGKGDAHATTGADHGPVFQFLLPALAILIAILVMLAVAGVFGGGDAAPAVIVLQALVDAANPPASAVLTPG